MSIICRRSSAGNVGFEESTALAWGFEEDDDEPGMVVALIREGTSGTDHCRTVRGLQEHPELEREGVAMM